MALLLTNSLSNNQPLLFPNVLSKRKILKKSGPPLKSFMKMEPSFIKNINTAASLPHPTQEGIRDFLSGSFITGIGKVYAKKITDMFGDAIITPDFDFQSLKEIEGIPERNITELLESISSLKVSPYLLSLLYSAGLKDQDIEKIVSHYGKRTEKIIFQDPYNMVENVWKFSFFSADKIGKFMGIDPDDNRRLKGALLTAVKLYAEDGNMFATEHQALQTASRITAIPEEKLSPLVDELIDEKRLVKSLGGLYLPVYFKAEEEAAKKIMEMVSKDKAPQKAFKIPAVDIKGNYLNDSQKKAIESVLKNKVTVVTGGPGTGKTTTINGVIGVLLGLDKKVTLVAPTGRAAKRMSDLTGNEAKTIHRLLGYSMGRGYKNKKIDTDILVIDEASMLEQVLFNHLLQAISDDTKLVLVGDTDQLPAIGAGNVLKDLIESGSVPVINLEENFRQKEGSLIAGNAARIKEGNLPEKIPGEDFVFIEEHDTRKIHSRLLSLVSQEIPSYTGIESKNIQIVTPQQEGALGAKQLNSDLQEALNPGAPEIKRGIKKFRLGDRVMQIMNSSEMGVYNGETGWISSLDQEEGSLEVTFFDGKTSRYGMKDLKELTLSYATTVHKLQGSETDYMVMVLSSLHKPMLYRNLLYTGVSRAKKLCVIVGDEKAVKMAVSTSEKVTRNSNFKFRLK